MTIEKPRRMKEIKHLKTLESEAKTIIELFETWEKTKWETLDDMYAFLHTKHIPLMDALSEEKKWAKHWAEEASIRKRELEDSEECNRTIREREERLQRIRECWTEFPKLTTSYKDAKRFKTWHNKMVKLIFGELKND